MDEPQVDAKGLIMEARVFLSVLHRSSSWELNVMESRRAKVSKVLKVVLWNKFKR